MSPRSGPASSCQDHKALSQRVEQCLVCSARPASPTPARSHPPPAHAPCLLRGLRRRLDRLTRNVPEQRPSRHALAADQRAGIAPCVRHNSIIRRRVGSISHGARADSLFLYGASIGWRPTRRSGGPMSTSAWSTLCSTIPIRSRTRRTRAARSRSTCATRASRAGSARRSAPAAFSCCGPLIATKTPLGPTDSQVIAAMKPSLIAFARRFYELSRAEMRGTRVHRRLGGAERPPGRHLLRSRTPSSAYGAPRSASSSPRDPGAPARSRRGRNGRKRAAPHMIRSPWAALPLAAWIAWPATTGPRASWPTARSCARALPPARAGAW